MHERVVSRYVDAFLDADMTLEYAKAVWTLYKADGTDLREIPSLAGQHTFVRKTNTEPTFKKLEGTDDGKDKRDLESMATTKMAASSSLRRNLQEVPRFCEDSGEALPTTVVKAFELALDGVEA